MDRLAGITGGRGIEIAAAGQRLQAFITGDTGPACEPLRINGLSHGYFSGSRSSMDEVIFRK